MRITTVLFDLDGTLLPMDQDRFIKSYFSKMAEWLAPHGYEPKELIRAIWQGSGAMLQNDGSRTNEAVFWETLRRELGDGVMADVIHFEEFYRQRFDAVQADCGFDARAAETVRAIKALGYRTALATNPFFPAVATLRRMAWAGLTPEDFELVTTFEGSTHCKPNPLYYADVMRALGVSPDECLMVGNDVDEDMVAAGKAGVKGFLLTDCLINRSGASIENYPHGDLGALLAYVKGLKNE